METKANYVAVGAFVLACIVGLVIAVLWLAGAQYSQEYAYYQTYFEGSVTGLGKGTAVRYNGIAVGQVDELAFDPADPKKVIVTLKVQQNLKLRTDSVASIASEGLAGGAYVEIDGGSKKAKFLTALEGQKYPVIPTKASTFEELTKKLNTLSDRANDALNDQNRKQLAAILVSLREVTANLSRTTAAVDKHDQDIEVLLKNLATASGTLDETLMSARSTAQNLDKLSLDSDAVIRNQGMGQLPQLIVETRALVASITRLSNGLERNPTSLVFGDRRQGYTPQ
ncbi:MAG TPA: MlaD family protein [Rhizomicrobium sp.]|jgi:phospholipid/cholesterol/gamma-HCH transport system substrate-binding protein|nr:MlaD family protein [Rhizomicrobium sp.]HEX4535095.1 MlaD family protein [Rhizomicrobium sp.]